jgi:hypothetical protein
MNDKLIELLGLAPGATEAQIISAVSLIQARSRAYQNLEESEGAIRKLIAASYGTLPREGAVLALDHQRAAKASRNRN